MKQNVKRINESQLRAIVAESVKKVLKEETFRGVDGTRFIWHGMNSDPEIEYNGRIYNYWNIENTLWYDFLEQTQWVDSDFDNPDCEEEFNKFCQENAPSLFMDLEANEEDDESINESTLNEYQFGDFTKRVGAGLSTFSGKKGSMSQKFQNAKANFKTQGEINDLNELLMKLQKYVDMKVFSPNATIADLIGDKWMMKGDKQGIKQRAGGLRGNIKQRGGQWH